MLFCTCFAFTLFDLYLSRFHVKSRTNICDVGRDDLSLVNPTNFYVITLLCLMFQLHKEFLSFYRIKFVYLRAFQPFFIVAVARWTTKAATDGGKSSPYLIIISSEESYLPSLACSPPCTPR